LLAGADAWQDLWMPKTARASVAETWHHAVNRGNRREAVFHQPADYDAFIETSSLADWLREGPFLWRGDVPVRDERWLERVNEPLSAGDLSRLTLSTSRKRLGQAMHY
jgi:hypothetical protein